MIDYPKELIVKTPTTFVNIYRTNDLILTLNELVLFKDNVNLNFKYYLIEREYIVYANNVVIGVVKVVSEIIKLTLNYSELVGGYSISNIDTLLNLFVQNKYIYGGYYLVFNKTSNMYCGKTLLI